MTDDHFSLYILMNILSETNLSSKLAVALNTAIAGQAVTRIGPF